MSFVTYCDNKGCRKEMAPVIDKVTNKVYCTECGQEINSVSDFMKRQLVSLNQVKRDDKRKLPYSVKCTSCSREAPPVLNDKQELVCSYCKEPMLSLSKPFADMLRQILRQQAKTAP